MKNTYYSFLINTCLFHSTGLNLVITSHTIGSVAWHCWWTAFRRFSTFTFYSRSDQDIFPFFLKNCATNKHMQFFFLEYKKNLLTNPVRLTPDFLIIIFNVTCFSTINLNIDTNFFEARSLCISRLTTFNTLSVSANLYKTIVLRKKEQLFS